MSAKLAMLIGLFLSFSLALLLAALVFLSPFRDWVWSQAKAWAHIGSTWIGNVRNLAEARFRHGGAAARETLAHTQQGLRRRALPLTICGTVVLGAPLAAWWLRGLFRVDSFDHTVSQRVDERIAALLQGEQLVPPAPLPPSLFMTPEVEEWRPDARHANRQWDLLDADFRQRLLLVFKLMQERHGYTMVLIEGYRSPERQASLAAMGPSVTRAGAGASYHQYGLAADCAFLRNGRVAISERDPWTARGYELYGETAVSVGLTWGGNWKSIKDLGHVELRRPGVLRRVG